MAFQHYMSQELKTTPNAVTETETSDGCFDCNICLDIPNEPVVTLCGHLYCWPCIYKWLHVQSGSLAPDEHPQCPVCKVDISHRAMVPLYGRGNAPTGAKASYRDVFTPPRPPASCAQALLGTSSSPSQISQQQQQQQLQYRNPYQGQHFSSPLYQEEDDQMLNLGVSTMTPGSHHHPVVGMFGEMVFARVFGNSENMYAANPNSYQLMRSTGSRRRRQDMQADKFLNRISIFLLCFFFLCLLVF